jgi:hypothetical protein
MLSSETFFCFHQLIKDRRKLLKQTRNNENKNECKNGIDIDGDKKGKYNF